MPITFPSRSAYRQEVKRRLSTAVPAAMKYASPSGAGECPPALRGDIPLPSWIALPQEDREAVIRMAVRAQVLADLGPMPDPAPGDTQRRKPEPAQAPAPATVEPEAEPDAEPEPVFSSRFFSRCSACGRYVGVSSLRARVTYCPSCKRARKRRV